MAEDFDIREVLALLSPAAIKFSNIPGTSPVKLTAHDVAARLRNCSRPANLLARGKYANDELSYRDYYFAFAFEVAGLPLALRLSKKFPKSLTALINITFQEMVSSKSCPWCRGKQSFTIINDTIIPCGACKGTGEIIWTDDKRAELMKVPERIFKVWYAPLHAQMIAIIARHEDEIVNALYERPPRLTGRVRPEDDEPPRAA